MSSDVTVIGLGAHGSSTLYFLSKKYPNLKITGIEKNTAGNQLGSSGGLSRIIRKAYFESPAYVTLLNRSYDLYREIEKDAINSQIDYSLHPQHDQFTPGHALLHITGGLDIGPADSAMVQGAIAACEANDLPYEILNSKEVISRWPITIPDGYRAVFQKDGGFLEPEKTNFTMSKLAENHKNAQIHYETSVIDVEQDEITNEFKIYIVKTADLWYNSEKIINGETIMIKEKIQDEKSLKSTATIITSKKIVLGTGPWIQDTMQWTIFLTQPRDSESQNGKMFKKLDNFFTQENTQVQRQVVNWHNIEPPIDTPTVYDSPNFPIFLIHHSYNYLTNNNNNDETNITKMTAESQLGELCELKQQNGDKVLLSSSNNNAKIDQNGNLIVDPSNTTAIEDGTNDDHFYYGFPSMRPGDNSMKIGRYHHLHEEVHQDKINRNISFLDIVATAHCAKYFFPHVKVPDYYNDAIDYLKSTDFNNLTKDNNNNNNNNNNLLTCEEKNQQNCDRIASIINNVPESILSKSSNTTIGKTCTFTNTFDGHFLIQPLNLTSVEAIMNNNKDNNNVDISNNNNTDNNPNILCLSGCSGHGYKFNAVIGEICADVITTGKSMFDIAWLGADRVKLQD